MWRTSLAEGLDRHINIIQAVQQRYLGSFIPPNAEEYEYWLNGKDPQVQLFNVSPSAEQKMSPNYSDYLRWKEERLEHRGKELEKQGREQTILDILHEAFD